MTQHLKIDDNHDIHIRVTPAVHRATNEMSVIGIRLKQTAKIWWYSAVLLGICGLSSLGLGGIVAIAILAGAIAGTAAAWGAFGTQPIRTAPPSDNKMIELEERLANVETIVSYEEKIVENKLRGMESRPEVI